MKLSPRVRQRGRRALAGLLTGVGLLLGGGGEAGSCPVRLTAEDRGGHHRLLAFNDGAAPVLLRVSLSDAQNVTSDRVWPVRAVLAPHQALQLALLSPAVPRMGYSFSPVAECTLGDPSAVHDPRAVYRLPFADNLTFPITQAYGGVLTTHNSPDALYAVDFTMPVGTPVVAARAGIVVQVALSNQYGGKEATLLSKANSVIVLHDDGTMGLYAHLAPALPLVSIGQRVQAGQPIGASGDTGYSAGPHLHFAVIKGYTNPAGQPGLQSLPFRFYVGRPPEAFVARAGLMVTANYSGSAPSLSIPTVEMQEARVIQTPPTQTLAVAVVPPSAQAGSGEAVADQREAAQQLQESRLIRTPPTQTLAAVIVLPSAPAGSGEAIVDHREAAQEWLRQYLRPLMQPGEWIPGMPPWALVVAFGAIALLIRNLFGLWEATVRSRPEPLLRSSHADFDIASAHYDPKEFRGSMSSGTDREAT